MDPVLTEAELAELLRLEPSAVERLLAETAVPRVTVAGQVRFVTADVLAWLSRQREPLLEPASQGASHAARREDAPRPETLAAADDDQAPVVSSEALSSLGAGGSDPALNLQRLQARDALIALGDALHPKLTRLSGGRLHLHPDEEHRTSPWRIEDPGGAPIEAIVLPWAPAEQPVPGFLDRPRVELRLEPSGLALSLRVPAGVAEPPSGARELFGPAMEGPDHDGWAVTLRHSFGRRPPTAGVAARRLEQDLEHLVPLWREVVDDGG